MAKKRTVRTITLANLKTLALAKGYELVKIEKVCQICGKPNVVSKRAKYCPGCRERLKAIRDSIVGNSWAEACGVLKKEIS